MDNDDGVWSLPYSHQQRGRDSPVINGGTFSPSVTSPTTGSSYDRFGSSSATIQGGGSASESTATLVPGQSRPSMALSTNVAIPSTAYPPLKHTWRRIRKWCDHHYSELSDTLNWPATEAQIEDLELEIGFALPTAVRDSYLCYNGQELESHQSCEDGLFFGLPLMSLDQIAEEWRFWRGVDEDPTSGANPEVKGWMNSCPAGWVRHEYSCRGWIPLVTDRVGNYVGIDLSPQPNGGGAPGQVILFGRDFDTKIVLWRGEGEGGWGRFLQLIAEELEAGEIWSLEAEVNSDSNDEEDAIGYEPYFSGSGAGRGCGDRGGDGAAQFKLRGEYKGWPVLEAWADRSMRSWDEIGMPAGIPAWRADPPQVVFPDGTASDEQHEQGARVNENGESLDAESSGTVSSSAQERQSQTTDGAGVSHPLDPSMSTSSSAPNTPKLGVEVESESERASKSSLSPPPMRSYGSRQRAKQREESWRPDMLLQEDHHLRQQQQQAKQRPRRQAPAPAAPLDLPTIDDVRAAHAAAIASQRRSGNYHYDVERTARPPPGSGGMGMGMGMGSSNSPGYMPRYANARRSGALGPESVPRLSIPEEDGLELENRPSAEVTSPLHADVSSEDLRARLSNDVVVEMNPQASQGDVNGARTPTSGGRMLYSAGSAPSHSDVNKGSAVGTLIDALEQPPSDVNTEHEQASASAMGARNASGSLVSSAQATASMTA